MIMIITMTTLMMTMVVRFLTAVGAVGLFNEAFTLTVEVMGAKEVSVDYNGKMMMMMMVMVILCEIMTLITIITLMIQGRTFCRASSQPGNLE